jgi:hypothetical protein
VAIRGGRRMVACTKRAEEVLLSGEAGSRTSLFADEFRTFLESLSDYPPGEPHRERIIARLRPTAQGISLPGSASCKHSARRSRS